MPLKDINARKAYHREYMKTWYAANKQKHMAYVRASEKQRQDEIRARIAAIKTRPCMDCGQIFDPVCMDFDHVLGAKIDNVSSMVTGNRPWSAIQAEIAKCEIVCSNCHRVRTRDRRKG